MKTIELWECSACRTYFADKITACDCYMDGCTTFHHYSAVLTPAGNSPVIGIDMASGPDHSVEVRYVAPPGYVMVPKEPTDEMIAAAMNCDDVEFNGDETFCVNFGNIYEAMLAAAPQEVPDGQR